MTESKDPSAKPGVPARLLVADDEESMRYFLGRALKRLGYEVVTVDSGESAIHRFVEGRFDLALVDLKMPGIGGIDVLASLRDQQPEALVVVMTGHASVETAVQAMKRGAFDYLTKPLVAEEVAVVIERALAHRTLVAESRDLRQLLDHRSAHAGLIGQSRAMRAVFQQIDALQGSSATVLLHGESGTGKELVARAVHRHSPRSDQPFLAAHCAAMSQTLIDSELFGHEPGAFTGATHRKQGVLTRADRGTLFLDEVAEIPAATQVRLLRFLQEGEVVPVGSEAVQKVDVRVIAATHRDLAAEVEAGHFREDLFYRLNVIPLVLPPLRSRREDIPALVGHFIEKFSTEAGRAPPALSVDATLAMTRYDWPGNVRELENAVQRIVVLHTAVGGEDASELGVDVLPDEIRGAIQESGPEAVADRPLQDAVAAFERAYFCDLFERTKGNISEAARTAGVSRGHLHRKIKALGVAPDRFRE